MIYRFPLRDVKDMLLNQIGTNFFKSIDDERLITKHMERTLERLERNICANDNKYYWRLNAAGKREAYFDPLHTCQWMLFLYLTANTIFHEEKDNPKAARVVCDKIYGQIKRFLVATCITRWTCLKPLLLTIRLVPLWGARPTERDSRSRRVVRSATLTRFTRLSGVMCRCALAVRCWAIPILVTAA